MQLIKRNYRICGDEINVKKFYSWYYCAKCKNTDAYKQIVRDLYENKGQSKFINSHKQKTKKILCLGCSKEIEINFFSNSKYCSVCKKNNADYAKKIKKQRCGEKEVVCKICDNKTKIKKYSHSKICKDCFRKKTQRKEIQKTNFYFTGPHRKLKTIINQQFPNNQFATEQWVSINKKRFSLDELDKEKKIVILVDGDYWHANPKKYTASQKIGKLTASQHWERDKFVTETLKNNGYVVLRFWQSTIDTNLDWCILSIKLVLQNFKKIQDIRKINSSIKSIQTIYA